MYVAYQISHILRHVLIGVCVRAFANFFLLLVASTWIPIRQFPGAGRRLNTNAQTTSQFHILALIIDLFANSWKIT